MIDQDLIPSPQPSFKLMKQGNLPFDLTIINNLKKYEVHGIVMSAISKKIYNTLAADPKTKKIELEYPDKLDVLSQIIDFCYGFDFSLNPSNFETTYLISTDLEISELQKPSLEALEKSFTILKVIPSLHFIHDAKDPLCFIEPHIKFIQQNFDEMMYDDSVISLPYDILEAIISGDEIKVKDEDALAFWVSKVLKERGEPFAGLVKCLRLASIGQEAQIELCGSKELDVQAFCADVKRAKQDPNPEIRQYLVSRPEVEALIQTDNQILTQFSEKEPVNGIIRYILDNQKKGIPEIRLKVSSTHDRYFLPKNLLELDNLHSVWYSEEWPKEQWIMYDFSPRILKINAYTLRTSGGKKGSGHLRSWKVTGSNDQRKWITIDERKDVHDLNSVYAVATYDCNCPAFFRFIKIEQTDLNHHNDYSFILSCCEFFGQAVPKTIK